MEQGRSTGKACDYRVNSHAWTCNWGLKPDEECSMLEKRRLMEQTDVSWVRSLFLGKLGPPKATFLSPLSMRYKIHSHPTNTTITTREPPIFSFSFALILASSFSLWCGQRMMIMEASCETGNRDPRLNNRRDLCWRSEWIIISKTNVSYGSSLALYLFLWRPEASLWRISTHIRGLDISTVLPPVIPLVHLE